MVLQAEGDKEAAILRAEAKKEATTVSYTHLFYYSNRNPLVTSFNVLLDNGRIPVALTNELSCSADCSQGIWI